MTLEPAPSTRNAPRYGQRILSRTRVGIERWQKTEGAIDRTLRSMASR
jgi:hypothetical protein